MLSGIHDTLMKVTLQTKTTAKKRGRANYLYDVQAWFYELARLPDELRRCVLLSAIVSPSGEQGRSMWAEEMTEGEMRLDAGAMREGVTNEVGGYIYVSHVMNLCTNRIFDSDLHVDVRIASHGLCWSAS
jgi:hypothetical protein